MQRSTWWEFTAITKDYYKEPFNSARSQQLQLLALGWSLLAHVSDWSGRACVFLGFWASDELLLHQPYQGIATAIRHRHNRAQQADSCGHHGWQLGISCQGIRDISRLICCEIGTIIYSKYWTLAVFLSAAKHVQVGVRPL